MLLSMYIDLLIRGVGTGFAARPLRAVVNNVASTTDGRSARLREPAPPGKLFANFHIVAEMAR